MTLRAKIRFAAAPLAVGLAMASLAGCDGGSGSLPATNPKPVPVVTDKPDSPTAGITIENESANMDKLRKAGVAR